MIDVCHPGLLEGASVIQQTKGAISTRRCTIHALNRFTYVLVLVLVSNLLTSSWSSCICRRAKVYYYSLSENCSTVYPVVKTA